MSQYLARLKNFEKRGEGHPNKPKEFPEPNCLGSLGAPPPPFPKNQGSEKYTQAIQTRPANAPAPPARWLVTTPVGEVFSLSRTPPATLAEIEADYSGAVIEPEPEPAAGAVLHPDDMTLAHAYLRHVGETDTRAGQEWIDGLAADPERLRQMYAEAVRLGIATFDPAPENPIEAPATGAVCARCAAFEPSRINPSGGMGRCLTDAPASRKAGSLWPWPDAEIRCEQFNPNPTKRPTP